MTMTQRWIATESNDNQDLRPENLEIPLGMRQPRLSRFGIFGPECVENFPMIILWLCTCTGWAGGDEERIGCLELRDSQG